MISAGYYDHAKELGRDPSGLRRAWRKEQWATGRGICAYCSEYVGLRASTVDHVIPLVKGGRDDETNWVVSCWDCNQTKGSGPCLVPPRVYAVREAAE